MGVEYDGSEFAGWQSQVQERTVQGCLEAAIARVADHPLRVQCAGRTDTGVHALGQVIHFDSAAPRSMRSWLLGVNSNLPPDVAARWAMPVADDFHARFAALRRSYRYVILNSTARSALYRRRVCWNHRPLDRERMAEAAAFLTGVHDFSSYRALGCQAKSPVRTVYRLAVERHGEYVFIDVEANAFLHHMVRNIAGVLMTIGAGDRPPDWASEILHYRDRTLGGVTAPPQGLFLMAVTYPPHFAIPGAGIALL
jgi:tRNA pseudouridine38-40 synthase